MKRVRFAAFAAAFCLTSIAGVAQAFEDAPLRKLEHVTLFVRDYDEALHWYVEKLGLVKIEDQRFGPTQRWLTVATNVEDKTQIVLAVPNPQLQDSIGKQHNWVFGVEDCRASRDALTSRGVHFVVEPQNLPWGCQAIIEDLYGNRIVLRSTHAMTENGR